MIRTFRVMVCVCWLTPTLLQAGSINKCVDPQGNVTYTDASCGSGQSLEQQFQRTNPKPSGDDTVRMAPPLPPPAPPVAPTPPAPVQVIPAPPAPVEPRVVYVPTDNGHRYLRPYKRSRYDDRRGPYGTGYQDRPSVYPVPPRGHDHRPRPPQNEKPRPTWRGESEATRLLIQSGDRKAR